MLSIYLALVIMKSALRTRQKTQSQKQRLRFCYKHVAQISKPEGKLAGVTFGVHTSQISKSVYIDVAKPKVTKSDRQHIETVLQEQRQNAILRDLADRGALDKMQIVAWDFSCDDPFQVDKRTYDPSYASSPEPVYEGSSGSCVGYHVTGQIHNGSNKTVTQIGVGFQALYGQQRCSSASLSETHRFNVSISPGAETHISFNVSHQQTGTLQAAARGCFGVTMVKTVN